MLRSTAIRSMLLVALSWPTCTALAQVEPGAAELLLQARQAHGGEALQRLATYREEVVVTIFGPAAEPVAQLPGTTVVDFAAFAYRDELFAGEDLVTISQVTPEGAWTWTPDTGTLRAPPTQEEELRNAFYRGLFGLRFGAERDAAEAMGPQTWRDVDGTAVRVTTEGVDTTYLLSEDGRMLAQRYASPQLGDVTVVFGDYRERDGVLIPFTAEYFGEAGPMLRTDAQEVEPDPELPADAFAAPADAPS